MRKEKITCFCEVASYHSIHLGHKHHSPLYSRHRGRGDKSPRSEDLEADDEQETTCVFFLTTCRNFQMN